MHITCYDPRNIVRPGTIVEDGAVPSLAIRDVALLPVDVEQYYAGPARHFSLRLLGTDGWRYHMNRPERGVHLPLFVVDGDHELHWFARFTPIEKNTPMSGAFKLLADSSGGALGGALRAIDRVDSLPELDRYEGVSVFGKCLVSSQIQGMMALMLHGVANNARCVALAVSAV